MNDSNVCEQLQDQYAISGKTLCVCGWGCVCTCPSRYPAAYPGGGFSKKRPVVQATGAIGASGEVVHALGLPCPQGPVHRHRHRHRSLARFSAAMAPPTEWRPALHASSSHRGLTVAHALVGVLWEAKKKFQKSGPVMHKHWLTVILKTETYKILIDNWTSSLPMYTKLLYHAPLILRAFAETLLSNGTSLVKKCNVR